MERGPGYAGTHGRRSAIANAWGTPVHGADDFDAVRQLAKSACLTAAWQPFAEPTSTSESYSPDVRTRDDAPRHGWSEFLEVSMCALE